MDGDFAWVNQGTASVDTTSIAGAIGLTAPTSAGVNLRIRKQAYTPPLTLTTLIQPGAYWHDFNQFGICCRDSATGEVETFGLVHTGVPSLYVSDWTNPTTFSANVLGASRTEVNFGAAFYLRYRDDGVNREWLWSGDGITFRLFTQQVRTLFLTPDEVGFFANSQNATYTAWGWLLSWLEA